MARMKLVVIALLVIVVAIIVLQNTQQVETQILFLTVVMPRAVLIVLSFMAGGVAGLLYASRRPAKKKE